MGTHTPDRRSVSLIISLNVPHLRLSAELGIFVQDARLSDRRVRRYARKRKRVYWAKRPAQDCTLKTKQRNIDRKCSLFFLCAMLFTSRFFFGSRIPASAGSYLLLCFAQTQLLNMFASQNVHAYRCLTAYDVALQALLVNYLIKPSGY